MKTNYPDASYLCDLAKQCGDIIVANFNLGMEKEWKEDRTPLTVTDIAIDNLAHSVIGRDYPHIRIIGEESSEEAPETASAEYTVLFDPLDGTIPFSHGVPFSTFCIAVLYDGKPIAGVIYDPFGKRMFHATRGKGSFLFKNQLSVSTRDTITGSILYAAVLNTRNEKFYNAACLAQRLAKEYAITIDTAAIGYFGGLVAAGEFDATIHSGTRAWETAAMQILVEEAGGRATDIYGNGLYYGPHGEIQGHIISNGKIHDKLVQIVSECAPNPS